MTAPLPSSRMVPAVIGLGLAAGAGLLWWTGPAPQYSYPYDVAAFLDASQRAALGQWLGRDFQSPIGPAALVPTVLAMRLGHSSVAALVDASVIGWLGTGLAAWLLARRRLPGWLAAAFVLFTAATAAAPYPLDFGSWRDMSYAMNYNRLSWTALCLGALVALRPGGGMRSDAAIFGALAACLWAIKPNYLLVLLPLLVPLARRTESRLASCGWAAAGAGGALLLCGLVVPFSPLGYGAIHFGMAGQAPGGLMLETLVRSLRDNALVIGLLAVAWLPHLRTAGVILPLAGATAATFLANMANCQYAEFPLWGALGWIAAAWSVERLAPGPRRLMSLGAAFGPALLLTVPPLAAIGYAAVWQAMRPASQPAGTIADSAAWRALPLRLPAGAATPAAAPVESAGYFGHWLGDGLALLRRTPHGPGAILCLDWINPFPFALGTAPAKGDEIAWHVGRTIGEGRHPAVEPLLAGAAAVMEPKVSVQPASLEFKRRLFAAALTRDFVLAGESPLWRVWLRRPSAPPAS